MKVDEALKSLDKNWSREKTLSKIDKGESSKKIIDDFFNTHKEEIDLLVSMINSKDKSLLNKLEDISICEANLIKKIKVYASNKDSLPRYCEDQDNDYSKNAFLSNFGLFMMKWSNKFVFITLIIISGIALSKQAWS